ncbi:hypothetical protein [Fimbriiglobus ruber]|uniref:Uncharacterized protein n=1 Tax=Fimbriiglobus ruber TaxID=1908690 RepID=A0A225D2J3_9BACT|nr:hypothetical protein [Fimbriiglobus ruber]OWK35163.1 hypothetical protein FRUB_10005 [Fimbriiglobus ruber]
MTKLDDWNHCNKLWGAWMYHEAAETGYDAEAAAGPRAAYDQAYSEFCAKYGEAFNPHCKPEETSILDDIRELGLRLLYGRYLDTCRGRAMEFEEWVVGQAV